MDISDKERALKMMGVDLFIVVGLLRHFSKLEK